MIYFINILTDPQSKYQSFIIVNRRSVDFTKIDVFVRRPQIFKKGSMDITIKTCDLNSFVLVRYGEYCVVFISVPIYSVYCSLVK